MKNVVKKGLGLGSALIPGVLYLASGEQGRYDVLEGISDFSEIFRGSSLGFIYFLIGLPVIVWLLLALIPVMDPKKKLGLMSRKYDSLSFLIVFIFSLLVSITLYKTRFTDKMDLQIPVLLIGFCFILLGNYLKTIRPNYFIGIRTPWTLESETVWRKTHNLASLLWVFGGFIILSLIFIFSLNTKSFLVGFLILLLVFFPFLYSFLIFKSNSNA